MKDKGYYFTIFTTAAAALLASFFIFPNRLEIATMYYYDRRYEESYKEFESLYESGDRSVSVIIPLTALDLHFAKEEHAAKIMQEFVAANPNDRGAKKALKNLFADLGRPYQYLSLSKGETAAEYDEERVDRERLYWQLGNFDNQEQQLRRDIDEGNASQENYIDLAYLLSSDGKMEEAMEILRRLQKELPPEKLTNENLLFVVKAELLYGEKERGRQLAEEYIGKSNDLKLSLALLDLFNKRGDATFILQLTKELPNAMQKNRALLSASAKKLTDMGRKDMAYQLLKESNAIGKKENGLDLFLLALDEENDPGTLLLLAEETDFSSIDRQQLNTLVEKLVARDDPDVAFLVETSLPEEITEENPLLDFALKVAKSPSCKKGASCQLEVESDLPSLFTTSDNLSDSDILFLASIYEKKGYPSQGKELLMQLQGLDEVPGDRLTEAAQLFIKLGLSDEGLSLIEKLKDRNLPKEAEVDEAWLLLATNEGKVEEVMEFLDDDESVDSDALEELFFLSIDKGYKMVALAAANELSEKSQAPHIREITALALILNGKADEGMQTMDNLWKEYDTQPESYLYALSLAAKSDESYRVKLRDALVDKLSHGEIDDNTKRDYAYLLLDNHFLNDAGSLFFELANNRDFSSDEVQSLLYSWEKSGEERRVDWIKERAFHADGDERGKWLQYLVDIKKPEAVFEITSKEMLSNEITADAYLNAISELKDRHLIAEAITTLYPQEKREKSLQKLAEIARYKELIPLSKKIYNNALEINPNDEKALLAMGEIYMDEGAPSIAKEYFIRYLNKADKSLFTLSNKHKSSDSYLANYYLGEISWIEKRKCEAKKYYRRSLELIQAEELREKRKKIPYEPHKEISREEKEERERALKTTSARIYLRLNKPYLTLSIYDKLANLYIKLPSLRIDYAAILMDLGRYRQAYRQLQMISPLTKKEESFPALYYTLELARLFRETNFPAASIHLLLQKLTETSEDLKSNGQNKSPLFASLAESYNSAGHILPALHYIDKAIENNPINSYYRKSRKEIVWEHLPHFKSNYEYRLTTPAQKEHFYRYHAHTSLSPFLSLEGKADIDKIELGALTSVTDGITTPFRGVRTRGELSMTSRTYSGEETRTTFYFAEGILGCGSRWKKTLYKDRFAIGIDLHKPDWENIQSTIERGTRDQIYVEGFHKFNRMWEVEASAKGNRYNLYHFSGAAVTWELEWLLTLTLPHQPHLQRLLGDDAALTINYQFDKEKVIRLKTKKDVEGNEFTPLLILNRETHTPFFFLNKTIRGCLSIEGYFGYLYDRIAGGRAHPVGGVALTLLKKQKNELRFDYNHSASTENTVQTVDSYLINIKHIF